MYVIEQPREEVERLIRVIFDYFNGRVNRFNYPARLEIEWGELYNETAGAISRNPNVVIIYPKVIARYMDSAYWFWYNVLVSIIHELYHTDQDISYVRMSYDMEYARMIENTVELESYLYLADHQQEIERAIHFHDIVFYNEYYNTIKQFECGRMYKRRNYLTHNVNMLKEIIYRDQINDPCIEVFVEAFNNPESKILYIFNKSEYLILKDGLNCCPLPQLNAVMWENIFKYTLREIKTSYTLTEGKNLVFEFEPNGEFLFVRPINKITLPGRFNNG